MEPKESHTTEPLDRSWGPAPISARRKQAREPTPDLEDAPDLREWWNQLGCQMKAEADAARNNARTCHTDKRDSPLISGGAGYNSDTLQTAPKAPRSTPVADMNKRRCVSTAVPENALRVSPQRTPTREKYRTAHCQQRISLMKHRPSTGRPRPPPLPPSPLGNVPPCHPCPHRAPTAGPKALAAPRFRPMEAEAQWRTIQNGALQQPHTTTHAATLGTAAPTPQPRAPRPGHATTHWFPPGPDS
jgi:hypothetical protein